MSYEYTSSSILRQSGVVGGDTQTTRFASYKETTVPTTTYRTQVIPVQTTTEYRTNDYRTNVTSDFRNMTSDLSFSKDVTVNVLENSNTRFASGDESEFLVVKKSRNVQLSEQERHHHYEELMQDNRRMREVIEQLQMEVDRCKSYMSTDTVSLQKELTATQTELERVLAELSLLRSGQDSKYTIEIDGYKSQILEWKTKYEQLLAQQEENAALLKQMTFLQNRVKMFELEGRKRMQEQGQQQSISVQLDEMTRQYESVQVELEQWRLKYTELQNDFNKLKLMYESRGNERLIQLEAELEALRHELKQWKMRYQMLLNNTETTSSKDYEVTISRLKQLLSDKEYELEQQRKTVIQVNSGSINQQSAQAQKMQQSYEDRLRQMQEELDRVNQQYRQMNQEMEGYRVSGSVYNQETFEDMQQENWKLQNQVEELEHDIDIFIEQVKGLQLTISELTSKLSTTESELGRFKTIVNQNQSKYNTTENLQKEISDFKYELEVWKNRYMQTELRLKEYDNLKIEYDELLRNQQSSSNSQITIEREKYTKMVSEYEAKLREYSSQSQKSTIIYKEDESRVKQLNEEIRNKNRIISDLEMQINNVRNSNNSSSELSTIKLQRDRLQQQISDYELRIRELQTSSSQKTVIREQIVDESKIRELNEVIQQRDRQISSLQQQLSTQVSSSQKTVIREQVVDESRIRELIEVIKQRDNQIQSLQQQISTKGSTTITTQESKQVLVIREELRTKEIRISELEGHTYTLQLEIERLQNLRKEQEIRIQTMIAQITDYESQLSILNGQIRMSRGKSPNQTSRQVTQTIMTNRPQATEDIKIVRNIYPQSPQQSEIVDRLVGSTNKFTTSTNNIQSQTIVTRQQEQTIINPKVIVSQYKS